MRSVDRIRVVGRSLAADLFTFWNAAIPPEDRTAYERAVEDYRTGEFLRADAVFKKLKAAWPDDTICSLYVERCFACISTPPQMPWDGIAQAQSK